MNYNSKKLPLLALGGDVLGLAQHSEGVAIPFESLKYTYQLEVSHLEEGDDPAFTDMPTKTSENVVEVVLSCCYVRATFAHVSGKDVSRDILPPNRVCKRFHCQPEERCLDGPSWLAIACLHLRSK